MTKPTLCTLTPRPLPKNLEIPWKPFITLLGSPSQAPDRTLIGVDLGHLRRASGRPPVTETCAYFFKENDLCRAHILEIPEKERSKCDLISTVVDRRGDQFASSFDALDWPELQTSTLIFRDFTFVYGYRRMGSGDCYELIPESRLFLHGECTDRDLEQLRPEIEMGLEGLSDAHSDFHDTRFEIRLDDSAWAET
ncbi:hypothetical protein ACSQ76_22020 [Roseovarius sp. B08]|uniref:hypothetical protein n=1 Tax=Roseovarius sp. B08 TaxID=3449223 RepID=UPI003EDBF0D0